MIKHSMNKLFLLCICVTALAGSLFAQVPTETPIASPTVPTAATAATAATSIAASASTATAAPTATASSASSDLADRIHRKLEKKLGRKHGIIIDADDKDGDHVGASEDIPAMLIPLVGIVFLSIFGAPVLIVILIGMFALLISRSRQRTVRMMVEKGQPVPAELLVPATRGVRQRSDARRGVVWTMVGLGLMIWLGAVNDWEGGAWSFGLIPFLIGLGYLIVWKLENKKDIPPPPPAP
jgi:Na+/proline symporter